MSSQHIRPVVGAVPGNSRFLDARGGRGALTGSDRRAPTTGLTPNARSPQRGGRAGGLLRAVWPQSTHNQHDAGSRPSSQGSNDWEVKESNNLVVSLQSASHRHVVHAGRLRDGPQEFSSAGGHRRQRRDRHRQHGIGFITRGPEYRAAEQECRATYSAIIDLTALLKYSSRSPPSGDLRTRGLEAAQQGDETRRLIEGKAGPVIFSGWRLPMHSPPLPSRPPLPRAVVFLGVKYLVASCASNVSPGERANRARACVVAGRSARRARRARPGPRRRDHPAQAVPTGTGRTTGTSRAQRERRAARALRGTRVRARARARASATGSARWSRRREHAERPARPRQAARRKRRARVPTGAGDDAGGDRLLLTWSASAAASSP